MHIADPQSGLIAIPDAARIPTRCRLTLLTLLVMLAATACAQSPVGPAFEPAPPPAADRGRVYLYRIDERGSLASVRVTLDGLPIGRLRNREYLTLELPIGPHRLRAGLRGFGFLAWGWNEHRFSLAPGETRYLELSVRLDARAVPDSRELEIAGRQRGGGSENVFILERPGRKALPELATTTRLERPAPAEPDRDGN